MRIRYAGPTLALAALTVTIAAAPQERPAGDQQIPSFRTATTLVVQNVTVRDERGQAVDNLTASDFLVTENGRSQEIAFAEFQRLADPPAAGAVTPVEPAAPLDTSARAAAGRITVPAPADDRFRDRRLLILYFDLSRMGQAETNRAFGDAARFVQTRMSVSDVVAIMGVRNGVLKVRQDFTADRSRLLEVLAAMVNGDDFDGDGTPDLDTLGSEFGQNSGEFNVFHTDRRLAALQSAIAMLQPLPQQKALLYFATGLDAAGVDNAAQYQSLINTAVRANVVIHPIDARGLVALSPVAGARRPSPAGMGVFTGEAVVSNMRGFVASQDTLYSLAKDTGGKAFLDYNDLTVGIVDAAATVTGYYMVAYHSTNAAADGGFRRVQVALTGGRRAQLSQRPGYYANKAWARLTEAEREQQLVEAFRLENPVTDMTLAAEINYFKLNSVDYYVPLTAKIPGSELTFARDRGAARTEFDFYAEVKDEHLVTHSNVRDRLPIRLSEESASQLAQRAINYQTGFTLLPGKYVVKLLVRDLVTGRIGTFQGRFTIPDLQKEATAIPLSTVVLSHQQVPLGSELSAVASEAAQAVDPLIQGKQRLLPSVTRVFNRYRQLFVYLQAYQTDAPAATALAAYITFFRDGQRVHQTADAIVQEWVGGDSRAVPLRFTLSIAHLPPGDYECQVTVLDPTTKKAAFWRAPILVV
jgi:VWFA-related protein